MDKMRENQFRFDTECPACGVEHDGMGQAIGNSHEPSMGDVVVCSKCGAVAMFNVKMQLKIVPEKNLESELPAFVQAKKMRSEFRESAGMKP